MRRAFRRYGMFAAAVTAIAWAGPACDGFSVTISFVVPSQSASIDTQTADLPAGAGLVVNNATGSTRVEVDPAATKASIQVTKIAFADSAAAAAQLLAQIVVVVQPASGTDNNVRIVATPPVSATSDTSQFEFNFDDDEFNVTGIVSGRRVAVVQLVIRIPPGHGVEVLQGEGPVRGIGLDTFISLHTDNGAVRLSRGNANATLTTGRGDLTVQDHSGSLEVSTPKGDISIDLDALASGQVLSAHTGDGGIQLGMPHDINAALTARTSRGKIKFDTFGFDDVSANFSLKTLTATINNGGPAIDLSTDDGDINIDGQR